MPIRYVSYALLFVKLALLNVPSTITIIAKLALQPAKNALRLAVA